MQWFFIESCAETLARKTPTTLPGQALVYRHSSGRGCLLPRTRSSPPRCIKGESYSSPVGGADSGGLLWECLQNANTAWHLEDCPSLLQGMGPWKCRSFDGQGESVSLSHGHSPRSTCGLPHGWAGSVLRIPAGKDPTLVLGGGGLEPGTNLAVAALRAAHSYLNDSTKMVIKVA